MWEKWGIRSSSAFLQEVWMGDSEELVISVAELSVGQHSENSGDSEG